MKTMVFVRFYPVFMGSSNDDNENDGLTCQAWVVLMGL